LSLDEEDNDLTRFLTYFIAALQTLALSKAEGNGYEVRFAEDKVKGQIMVIYIDIFGNEKREIKTVSDFDDKREKE
jgi:ATP/maltotriose-dependent transcriptional regulator MalT